MNLFVYGTLRDPDIQMALFGRYVPPRKACLEGWSIYAGEDGFLFIQKNESGEDSVEGLILELSDEELRIADHWEGEGYALERVYAYLEHAGIEEAFVYTKPYEQGKPHNEDKWFYHDKEDIIEEIIRWRR